MGKNHLIDSSGQPFYWLYFYLCWGAFLRKWHACAISAILVHENIRVVMPQLRVLLSKKSRSGCLRKFVSDATKEYSSIIQSFLPHWLFALVVLCTITFNGFFLHLSSCLLKSCKLSASETSCDKEIQGLSIYWQRWIRDSLFEPLSWNWITLGKLKCYLQFPLDPLGWWLGWIKCESKYLPVPLKNLPSLYSRCFSGVA